MLILILEIVRGRRMDGKDCGAEHGGLSDLWTVTCEQGDFRSRWGMTFLKREDRSDESLLFG